MKPNPELVPNDDGELRCRRCLEWFPVDRMKRRTGATGRGFTGHCKRCHRELYSRNPESELKRTRRRNVARRIAIEMLIARHRDEFRHLVREMYLQVPKESVIGWTEVDTHMRRVWAAVDVPSASDEGVDSPKPQVKRDLSPRRELLLGEDAAS